MGKGPVTDRVTGGLRLKFVMADILGFIFSCSLLAEDGRTQCRNTGLLQQEAVYSRARWERSWPGDTVQSVLVLCSEG